MEFLRAHLTRSSSRERTMLRRTVWSIDSSGVATSPVTSGLVSDHFIGYSFRRARLPRPVQRADLREIDQGCEEQSDEQHNRVITAPADLASRSGPGKEKTASKSKTTKNIAIR